MAAAASIEIETGSKPSGSVIWLHGLGADGHDFEPIVPELRLPPGLPLRFVFPHAPIRPVTINGGVAMRAWYDIISFDRNGPVDAEGIEDSSRILADLIGAERERGMDPGRIVVAGFSQGGAIALHTALRYPARLAGLMALSTYLPLPERFRQEVQEAPGCGDTTLPLFMAHGSYDPMLPMKLGEDSAALLEAAGFEVEWHDYPMAHAVCAEEIHDIRRWLLRVFGYAE